MSATNSDSFIELNDYWLSISRKDFPTRGFGKWRLYGKEPHHLYQILRDNMVEGGLKEAFSIKTRAKKPGDFHGVYIYTAPYTDQGKVLRLAEGIQSLNKTIPLNLTRPLTFKTDLHNTWEFTLSLPGDGYQELLKKQNWIYKYSAGELVINAIIQALHQVLEDPPENADPEFLIIRSMLPEEVFADE